MNKASSKIPKTIRFVYILSTKNNAIIESNIVAIIDWILFLFRILLLSKGLSSVSAGAYINISIKHTDKIEINIGFDKATFLLKNALPINSIIFVIVQPIFEEEWTPDAKQRKNAKVKKAIRVYFVKFRKYAIVNKIESLIIFINNTWRP